MRKAAALLLMIATCFSAVGCEYESPLAEEHDLRTDGAVLGLWESVPNASGEVSSMLILKYSDTEYLIQYPMGEDALYYRGYPAESGGVSCVQLRVIGTASGPPQRDDRKLFHVASYRLIDAELEMRLLNTDLVKNALKTTAAIRDAFLASKDDVTLFTNPGRFRKVNL